MLFRSLIFSFLIITVYRLVEGEAAVIASRKQKDKETDKDKPSFFASLNSNKDKDKDKDGETDKFEDKKDENDFDIDTAILSDGAYTLKILNQIFQKLVLLKTFCLSVLFNLIMKSTFFLYFS